MIKLIGVFFIIGCTSAVGFKYSSGLSKRVRQLERCISMIHMMISELQYSLCPTMDLLNHLSAMDEFQDFYFLNACKNLMNKSVPFTTSWRTSLLSHSENLQLSGDDKKVLLRVGDILGAMDGENQVGELKLIETTLDDRLEQARLSREKYGKLYRSLGVLAGVGISIFML
ncbi:stage III sporulation protein AB [Candidatus Soleaferrea massiliensis]|uniref:stage III sporulation protein AB n=1 Tax=Candidatus Soleaferrea massiliensis TaxID=1470354 RepID=UPI00058D8DAE|nr:stage III sporulation protein AB [Candidatus Soleaferrea massiliensis]